MGGGRKVASPLDKNAICEIWCVTISPMQRYHFAYATLPFRLCKLTVMTCNLVNELDCLKIVSLFRECVRVNFTYGLKVLEELH